MPLGVLLGGKGGGGGGGGGEEKRVSRGGGVWRISTGDAFLSQSLIRTCLTLTTDR